MYPIFQTLALVCVVFADSSAFADPPNLDCLSGITINEFLEDADWDKKQALLLMDSDNADAVAWESSVWNDPVLVEFIESQEINVIWLDPSEEKYYSDYLNQLQQPTVRFGIVPTSPALDRMAIDEHDTPKSIIDWLSPALNGSTLFKELQKTLRSNPDDTEARWKYLNEYRRQPRPSYAQTLGYENLLKLLELNKEWFGYMHNQEGLSEQQFRAILIQVVSEYRIITNLFGEPEDDGKKRFIRSGWKGAIEYAEGEVLTFNYGKGVMHRIRAVRFRRSFEDRCENAPSDRDLFILHALTAEGEEWQQLVDKYQE